MSYRKLIDDKFGIRVFKDGKDFYMQFDIGHFNIDYREVKVSEAQVVKAMNSSQEALEVMFELKAKIQ